MAAKGAWAKEQIWNKILTEFNGAFVNEKEIRVPMIENGERVEIKITLTCAKVNVGGAEAATSGGTTPAVTSSTEPAVAAEPTEEEKKNVTDFLNKLGLS